MRKGTDPRILRQCSTPSGFTMIELLVTMLLLTVVLLGLAALQVHTIRSVTSSKRANEATRLCQAMVERYRSMQFNRVQSLAGTNWTIPTNSANQPMKEVQVDGVTAPGPFTVQQLVEDVSTPGSQRLLITVRVSWLDTSTGNNPNPGQQYRMLDVVMTTQRTP